MEMNEVLFAIVGVVGCAMLLAYVLRYFGVPAAVAYIVTGLVAGPSGLALVEDQELLRHVGEIGVIMLLFFIGMEVSLPRLIAGWRIAVLGTIAQMALSVGVCSLVSWLFGWPWQAGLLFGFIISMSSTAVVLTMLKDSGELNTPFGQNALGVLLMQDMAIVPIMIILGTLGAGEVSASEVSAQVIGGSILVALAFWLMRKPGWHIPESLKLTLDRKIMMGLLLCFSSAALTSWIGLSAPFGAFLAGMILNASDQAEWVEEHLRSLYVVFVAVFFMSVGMLVDISFILSNLGYVAVVTLAVFLLNSGINTLVLRTLGETWSMALLTGGMLSQIGELSFLLASLGVSIGLLNEGGHQMAIAVIALSLMLSPFWMLAIRFFVREDTPIMQDQDINSQVNQMVDILETARAPKVKD